MIPTKVQLSDWFDETVQIPSFVTTLTIYQKDKLLQYTIEKIKHRLSYAFRQIEVMNANNFPKDLPEEKWLEYLVHTNMSGSFGPATFVLNVLGWHWTLDKSFHKLPKSKDVKPHVEWNERPIADINAKWEYLVNEGEKLTQRQIALICWYEGIVIPKPGKQSDVANKITQFHGHGSGQDLYNNHYLKVCSNTDRLNQHSPKKTKKDIEKVIRFLSSGENVSRAIKDLSRLDEKIRRQEK